MSDGFSVTLSDVSKRYGTEGGQTVSALEDISLTIDAGAVVAIMGPSGSGKSTLLTLSAQWTAPTAEESP